MTGNDTLNARFLHENSFDFKPQFKRFIECVRAGRRIKGQGHP
jgi:hypothetical protein